MSNQFTNDNIIIQINRANSFKELDAIAIEYFNKHGSFGSADVMHAISIKEQQLEWDDLKSEAIKDMQDMQPDSKNVVALDITKKKPQDTAKTNVTTIKQAAKIQCGCPVRYGVPCIHQTNFDGIVPDDYESCVVCGCDHKYDSRLANEVHSKVKNN